MFCPNCGSNNSTEQKFCRSCGLNLEQSAASLLEQMPSAQGGGLAKKADALETFGAIATGGFGFAVLGGACALIYWTFVKMVLSGADPVAGMLLIVFFIFAAMMLAYIFLNEVKKDRKSKINPELLKELDKNRETGKLLEEGEFQPASVTERTTDLLYSKNKTGEL